jgi:hypothetical protein
MAQIQSVEGVSLYLICTVQRGSDDLGVFPKSYPRAGGAAPPPPPPFTVNLAGAYESDARVTIPVPRNFHANPKPTRTR